MGAEFLPEGQHVEHATNDGTIITKGEASRGQQDSWSAYPVSTSQPRNSFIECTGQDSPLKTRRQLWRRWYVALRPSGDEDEELCDMAMVWTPLCCACCWSDCEGLLQGEKKDDATRFWRRQPSRRLVLFSQFDHFLVGVNSHSGSATITDGSGYRLWELPGYPGGGGRIKFLSDCRCRCNRVSGSAPPIPQIVTPYLQSPDVVQMAITPQLSFSKGNGIDWAFLLQEN